MLLDDPAGTGQAYLIRKPEPISFSFQVLEESIGPVGERLISKLSWMGPVSFSYSDMAKVPLV